MVNRWMLAVLVCTAAFTCYRYLDRSHRNQSQFLKNKRVKLRAEKVTYPEYDQVDRVDYLDDEHVMPTHLGKNKFLTSDELFAAPLSLWHLDIYIWRDKSGENYHDQAHFHLDRTFLARLLLGLPEQVPIVAVGMTSVKIGCLGAMLWMEYSHWSKRLACKQRLSITVDDQFGQQLTGFSTTMGEDREELDNKLQVSIITITAVVSKHNKPLDVAATFVPLTKGATRKGLDDMLARKKMSFDHFRGVGPMEEFGFFINASILLRNPGDTEYAAHMHCWGDLFMAADTRGRPFDPSDASQQSEGYFNLGQHGTAKVPLMIRRLDYYLGQGIKNRALMVSLPEFSCRLLGNDFLMSALNSSLALVLKPTFPYISLEQSLYNIRGIEGHLETSISQVAGPRHSERKPQYKTTIQVDYANEMANFSRALYQRVINTPASSPSSDFLPSDAIEPRREEYATICKDGSCMFADASQFTTSDVVDGRSTLLFEGIAGVNVALNFTQMWSDSYKQHHLEIYTYSDQDPKRPLTIKSLPSSRLLKGIGATERLDNITQILASIRIHDSKKADSMLIRFNLSKKWRAHIKRLIKIDHRKGHQRLLNRLKLPQLERRADRREQVLLERDFKVLLHQLKVQERLQRCSTDQWLAEVPEVKPQINCLPDGEDNDLYARQLLVRKINGEMELACYPLKREIVIKRIMSASARLHDANYLISSKRLEGFVQDYLKLGAYCVIKNFTDIHEAATLRLNIVMAINETTSSLQKETDGDDHDTLVDQWNWLLEAIFSGRISNGLMIDQTIQMDVRFNSFLGVNGPTIIMGLNSSLLLQESFPFLTYASTLFEGSLVTVLGTVNQTCHDKPVQEEEYQFLDLKTGINSILLSNEQDPAQQYSFDSITRTSCAVYNTSYSFYGSSPRFGLTGGFIYNRTVHVNATVANATEMHERSYSYLESEREAMTSSGREDSNKRYYYQSIWWTLRPNANLISSSMRVSAEPEDENLQSHFVVGKEYIYSYVKMIKDNLEKDAERRALFNRVELFQMDDVAEMRAKIDELKSMEKFAA